MNRTLDTYFTKRQQEKQRREKFPMPAQTQDYYMPNIPPQSQYGQRAYPKPPAQPPKPRKAANPYADLFGLSQDDYDDYYKK